MVVTRVKLTNWRNFQKVDVRLSERTFVVGPNAAGKSNFLDVFRFLRDVASGKGGGLQQAVSARGGVSKLRSLAARKNPKIEIEVQLANGNAENAVWRYGIGIKQENKGKRRILLAYEKVWRGDDLILNRPDEQDQRDAERLTQTYLENPSTNEKFRQICQFFVSVSYLHLVPQLLRTLESVAGGGSGEDYYGKNFLARVAKTPHRIRDSRLKRIEYALRIAVPQFDELRLEKDDAGIPHLEVKLTHWRPGAGRQREDQFSDGTIRMIGLFWSLLESDSLLLFEEPELSLNDRIVSQLPSIIWKLQSSRGRQVLLSTHSHALLEDPGIRSDEIILLRPDKEGTAALNASSIEEVDTLLKAGMTAADAVLPHTVPAGVDELSL